MDLCALVPHRAARLSASSCGAAARTPSGGALRLRANQIGLVYRRL